MSLIIYLVSFLEWFTTLSIEIIAIRRFTPIIWVNSISTSIILWVILLALSYWYYIWWKNTKNLSKEKLIKKIIFNLVLASVYYLFFTFLLDKIILSYLIGNLNSYFFAILISSFLLFFIPVVFASQTIPLLSEILKWDNTWEKVGKLLFFSTIGSFLGSVFTSSVLFPYIWVYNSSVFNSIILAFIASLLSFYCFKEYKKFFISSFVWFFILILSLSIIFSEKKFLNWVLFKTANSYQDIEIYEQDWKRIFALNWWYSSGIEIETKESFFGYIKEIKKNILQTPKENKKILVIWAAWFTLPQELAKNEKISEIDVVDVDWSLKDISEKYFLQEKLDKKINFIVEPSRYFLNNTIKNWKFYDEIVLDIYVWKSLPSQTLTLEFFENVKKIWENIYINIITDKDLSSDFSKKLFTTIKKSLWEVFYIFETYDNSWNYLTNFVVTNKKFSWYFEFTDNNEKKFYTDDSHSIEIDIFKRWL